MLEANLIEDKINGNKEILSNLLNSTAKTDTQTVDNIAKMILLNAQYYALLSIAREKIANIDDGSAAKFIIGLQDEVISFEKEINDYRKGLATNS